MAVITLSLPVVDAAALNESGAGLALRLFLADTAQVDVAAVRIRALIYYSISSGNILATVNVAEDDPMNAATNANVRTRQLQTAGGATPSGPDVGLKLEMTILAPSSDAASLLAEDVATALSNTTALASSSRAFAAFDAAFCSKADCSGGLLRGVETAVVQAQPVKEEEKGVLAAAIGGAVGGFAAAALMFIGLYFIVNHTNGSAKAAKVPSSGPAPPAPVLLGVQRGGSVRRIAGLPGASAGPYHDPYRPSHAVHTANVFVVPGVVQHHANPMLGARSKQSSVRKVYNPSMV